MSKCRSCPAEVLWAKHKKTGRANPLDPKPSLDGNILLDRTRMVYEVLAGDDLKRAHEQGLILYISHFATCPNARSHRKSEPARGGNYVGS
jgi:hypothetical protein